VRMVRVGEMTMMIFWSKGAQLNMCIKKELGY
jgi:hypothetical protein